MGFDIQALNPNINKLVLLSFWGRCILDALYSAIENFLHALFARKLFTEF